MRQVNLESMIEDWEHVSPDYVDNAERQKLLEETTWINWAEQQLAMAQREQESKYKSDRPIDLVVVGTNPLSGVTWRIETTSTANRTSNRYIDTVPATMSAPQLNVPKIGSL